MSYVWCHGPSCHTYSTQDRVRGSKGSKVLRTRKIKQTEWNSGDRLNMYSYFCSMGCYNDFAKEYMAELLAIAPRTECLETPIHDPTREAHDTTWGYKWYDTKIEVDETRQS